MSSQEEPEVIYCGPRPPSDVDKAIVAAAGRMFAQLCWAQSEVLLPKRARLMRDPDYYHCGKRAGHPPPHRWPADETRPAIAEWTDEESDEVHHQDPAG